MNVGTRADVVTLYNAGAVADALRADGVRVVDLGMSSNHDIRALRDLGHLVRAGKYDVVHTHLYRAGLYGRLAARLAKVPLVVSTEHSLVPGSIEGRRTSKSVRALYLAACGAGHPDQGAAIRNVLGSDTAAVTAAWRVWLRG